jgi:DeoR/GlpR family transcriptional regulator of sugar metabolism
VARALKKTNTEGLTVITHALNIGQELVEAPNISLLMIGGVLRHLSGSFVGP